MNDIERRTGPSADPIGTFGAHDITIGVSYARNVGKGAYLGTTLKLLWESIDVETSQGWAFDIGVQYRGLLPGLSLGAALNHLGEMNALRNEGPSLPTRLRIGGAYEIVQIPHPQILIAVDGELPFDGDPNGHVGMEIHPIHPLALRVGYITGIETRSFTVGFGLDWNIFHVNYAFAPFKEDLGDGHRIALGLDL